MTDQPRNSGSSRKGFALGAEYQAGSRDASRGCTMHGKLSICFQVRQAFWSSSGRVTDQVRGTGIR